MSQSIPQPRPPQFTDHSVGGHTFRAARWQAEHGHAARPLLFFTGIGANVELLAPLLEHFLHRDIITLDMPGTGGTPDYPRPYRLATIADAANGVLDQFGWHSADVMGVSWGGMLAQEFAFRHPDRVGRLILSATAAGFPMIPGRLSTIIRMMNPHRYSDATAIGPFLQSLYGGDGKGMDSYAARMRPPSSTGYLHQILAILGWTSVRKLTGIRARTLILMGGDDRLVPAANGHILKFLLRDAELRIIPDAGHLFVLSHAAAVARMIDDFLDAPDAPRREALPVTAALAAT